MKKKNYFKVGICILTMLVANITYAQDTKTVKFSMDVLSPLNVFSDSNDDCVTDFSLNILGERSSGSVGLQFSGIYSINVDFTRGVQFAGIINYSAKSRNAIQLSGISNIAKDGVVCAQLTGLFNYANRVEGGQIAGLVNVANDIEGGQVAGLVNSIYRDIEGGQVAGLVNKVRNVEGGQVAGLVNKSRNVDGGQVAGLVNTARLIEGVQIAGLVNAAKGNVFGVQIAGLSNVARDVYGVQVGGLVNVARNQHGVQVGLFNYSDRSDGVSVGLINIVKHGGKQEFEISFSEAINTAVSFRLGNNNLYTIFSGGINYIDTPKVEYAVGLGLGTHMDWRRGWGSQIEVLGHLLTEDGAFFENHDINMLTQIKYTFSKQFCKRFKIFAGPVINLTISDNVNPVTGVVGSSLSPWSMWSASSGDLRFNSWIGFTAGVRF